jgi:hypothetical protein
MKFVNKLLLPSCRIAENNTTINNSFANSTNITVIIEREPYVLNNTIQSVYKYLVNDMLVVTYYTNGYNTELYPVYHDNELWPKEKLEKLLDGYLPEKSI